MTFLTVDKNSADLQFHLNSLISNMAETKQDNKEKDKNNKLYQQQQNEKFLPKDNTKDKNSKLLNIAKQSFSDKTKEDKETNIGSLDLIYAKEGDAKYNSELDMNKDSQVSYMEYLRYCEQNAKTEAKNSDTKITGNYKDKFVTVSFGHASNAYNRVQTEPLEGKIEGKA